MSYPPNPTGIGGFRPGQPAANPGGRPRGASKVQLFFLSRCLEAGEVLVRIMHKPEKDDNLRLAAINAILDRGMGRPIAAVNLDLTLNKPLENMTREELIEFRQKYAAIATASPLLIGELIDEGKQEQEELPLSQETTDG